MKAQNTEDVFTLEKVKPPYFFYIQEEGIVYKYNAELLANFIEDTGCRKDPQSQQVYNSIEIHRLERITGRTFVEKQENTTEDMSTVIPFLESEVGNAINCLLETDNNIEIDDLWVTLLQSLQEIKSIGVEHYKCIMNNSIRNVQHEYTRLEKQQRMFYVMLRYGKSYDFFVDKNGTVTICLDDKHIFTALNACLKRAFKHKKIIIELKRTLYYHTRFRELMIRLNELPTIPEHTPLL